jgi:hydroxymethylpyrimidine/phosphomethylpyrimidine kinase
MPDVPGLEGVGRVLIIAGSDSGGGAGIQGDIKTVTCLGGYAATAITALTAQNTQGVFDIHNVADDFIRKQITLVADDIGVDAFKTGMLHKSSVIDTVAGALKPYIKNAHFVLDPVMFAKGGSALLQPDALSALKEKLIPLASIITPNVPEAEYLSGMKIHTTDDMLKAAKHILALGCRAVLLKGGHLETGGEVTDILVTSEGHEIYSQPRIDTPHTHGTGCTLASAIATGLAQKMALTPAVKRARAYVLKAIAAAPKLGKGHGPLGHGHTVTAFTGE